MECSLAASIKNLNIDRLDSAILLLQISLQNTSVKRYMFKDTSYIIHNDRHENNQNAHGEWLNKLWYVHMM